MRVGTAGGAVRDRASAADVALASWCSRRSTLPPKSSGGFEFRAWSSAQVHVFPVKLLQHAACALLILEDDSVLS